MNGVGSPYRSAFPGSKVEADPNDRPGRAWCKDATDEEIVLWDALVCHLVNTNDCKEKHIPVQWADSIVSARRERFGRRIQK